MLKVVFWNWTEAASSYGLGEYYLRNEIFLHQNE